jgi:hypothetical protein
VGVVHQTVLQLNWAMEDPHHPNYIITHRQVLLECLPPLPTAHPPPTTTMETDLPSRMGLALSSSSNSNNIQTHPTIAIIAIRTLQTIAIIITTLLHPPTRRSNLRFLARTKLPNHTVLLVLVVVVNYRRTKFIIIIIPPVVNRRERHFVESAGESQI